MLNASDTADGRRRSLYSIFIHPGPRRRVQTSMEKRRGFSYQSRQSGLASRTGLISHLTPIRRRLVVDDKIRSSSFNRCAFASLDVVAITNAPAAFANYTCPHQQQPSARSRHPPQFQGRHTCNANTLTPPVPCVSTESPISSGRKPYSAFQAVRAAHGSVTASSYPVP